MFLLMFFFFLLLTLIKSISCYFDYQELLINLPVSAHLSFTFLYFPPMGIVIVRRQLTNGHFFQFPKLSAHQ